MLTDSIHLYLNGPPLISKAAPWFQSVFPNTRTFINDPAISSDRERIACLLNSVERSDRNRNGPIFLTVGKTAIATSVLGYLDHRPINGQWELLSKGAQSRQVLRPDAVMKYVAFGIWETQRIFAAFENHHAKIRQTT